jgi:hypothetical protein
MSGLQFQPWTDQSNLFKLPFSDAEGFPQLPRVAGFPPFNQITYQLTYLHAGEFNPTAVRKRIGKTGQSKDGYSKIDRRN